MARSRWELEENRKKKEQEKARQAILKAAQTQRESWQEGAAARRSTNSSSGSAVNNTNRTSTASRPAASRTAAATGSSTASAGTGLRDLASFNQQMQQLSSGSSSGLSGGALRRRTNIDSRTGTNTSRGAQREARESTLAGGAARRRTNVDSRTGTNTSLYMRDMADLQRNQALWHLTDDQAERDQLHAANNAIRQRRGLSYDRSGVTYDPESGENLSLPAQMIFGGTTADRIRNANNWRQSREFFGMDEDDTTALPSMAQIAQAGDVQAAWGTNAHQVMADLFNRSAEEWTEEDTRNRDAAVHALENEMSDILSRYGLHYRRGLLDTGGWSTETATDQTALDMLERAGADKITRLYVQENINQRQAADRLGQGLEAVAKRAIGSIPAFGETVQQQAANVAESRENPEYVQLEQQEQELENQLTSMQSTNYDGSLNQDYVDIYNQWQAVRQRMQELAVDTPVDQSKWGQTMLREAAEAQTNATAGLSAVPRFLANTGISIAGNAPVMATSLIPGVGPAVGAGLMGASAAGQRAQELSAQGASPGEAISRGLVSGAIEAVTEKLPLDTMADILNRGGSGFVRNLLRQMGVEAGEESASYVMNYAADLAARDPDAQFSFAELAEQALGGALSGGFFGAAGTLGGRVRTGAQTAQETANVPQAGNNAPIVQDAVQGDFTANENSPVSTGPVRTGRVTTIQSPYTGKTPVNVSPQTQGQALSISPEAVDSARQAIFASQQSGTFARTIKSVLQSIFQQQGGPRSVRVQGVTFDGQPYEVALNPNIAAKVASDRGMSAEKVAVFNSLDQLVATAEYVGSGNYNKNRSKAGNVVRYDYFEKPLTINGQPYVATFDVEVHQDRNNFRTYRVINEIDLTQGDAMHQSLSGSGVPPRSGLSNNSIPQTGGNSNPIQTDAQTLAVQLAGLDSAMRTAENLLPGPARDARIAEIRAEMERVQAEAAEPFAAPDGNGQMTMREFQQRRQAQAARDFAAAGEPIQAEQPAAPEVNVPVSEAVQYGATPQQAMREAEVRAQGEAVQETARSEREETVSTLLQAWNDKRTAEKQAEQTLAGLTLTDNDIRLAQNAAASGVDTVNWEYADDPEKAYLYGKTLRAVREADQPIRQYFARRATALQSEAQKAADAIAAHAKEKKTGGQYQRETMERNIRDIFGKDHQTEAEAIIREYITPVHKAVAEGNKLKNSMRERVKALKLNKHERALVQMRLEAEDGAAAEYIENNKIKVTPKMDAKINHAVEEFRSIYNELHRRINETQVLNGQEPTLYRKNYAPHFTKGKRDLTLLGRARLKFGLGASSNLNQRPDSLPTDIAGISDTFRPGKKWFGHLLQREGEITDYDVIAGFETYIEDAADVITLTESIQKLRALEDQIRCSLSSEGVRAKIDEIRNNPELNGLQQRQEIEKAYDEQQNPTTAQRLIQNLRETYQIGMGRFVTELRRYTDNLAGKKSREDRGWEDMANRQVYQLAKSLEGRVAANMISLNPGSWLTNIIPITQATGEVSVPNLVRGMFQTVKANIKDDGYRDASAFLTNRYGSESIDKTIARRVSDLSSAPMELIDHFVANTIHRARYAQNIDRGMSMDEAIDDADAYTASLMADRSKGALPTAFNATNPIRKVFTMFQTEVNNQLSYLFKDMPRAQRQKGVAAVAWAYTKVFGTAYLFNLAYSQLTGRDSAFDPIGMIADALGIGDDEDDERTVAERLTGLAEDIGGNIPFVGGVLFDGGRVPISSAFPDFINLGKAVLPSGWTGVEWSGDKRAQTALKEIAKPLTYLVPPFGGGAAKRAIEGFATVNAGGSYTYDNEGNRTLQFPTYGQTPLDYARAMLFGKWSSEEAQEYIDNGFKGLSADETAVFDQLRNSMGLDARQAMDTILSLRGFETDRDEEGNILQTVKDQKRLALFDNDNLTPEQKAAVDRALIVSGEDEQPADYENRNTFLLTQYVSENRREDARQALLHGLDIDQFVTWDDRLRELTNEKGTDDKKVRSAAAAREMVINEVMQDNALTDGEKQSIADYVIVSSMSDSAQETWETVARGHINASDYVYWTARISQLDDKKNEDDENIYTSAEVRNKVLNELTKNRNVDEETMERVAEYVLLPSMGDADEKTREDWANIVKGNVKATDYVRFKDDVSIYEEQAKGSGTDNIANVAEILRGYDGLTDTQRDVLFQTFNSTMKNNPFHVSEYELAVQDNQFYQDLSKEGKAALRALTNEYEQAVNDGKELKDWLAKAYMADKEADIAPGIYALYRVALDSINAQVDGNTNRSQAEVEAAVKSIPGLTQYQKAYLWQSANKDWKKNPFGSATVGEYQSGVQEAINPVPTGSAPGEDGDFGPRNAPIAGASTWHKAYDIPANGGDPVVSIMDGTVTSVNKSDEWGGGYGISVRIDHGNGIETEYHHMQVGSTDNINVGDKVTQGQQIGKVGSTGNSSGNHLDFQVWKDGKIVDPLTVIPGYGKGPSGYVYDGTVSSGVVSSGAAKAAAEEAMSSGLKDLKGLSGLKKLG